MKKIILSIVATAATFLLANSQDVRMGFNAGAVFANYKVSADNISMKFDTKVGFTVGVLVDVPLSDQLSMQPALNFVQKGFQNKDASSGTTITDKGTVNMLEVPVNFLFNTRGSSGNFFVGAGPSLAFGISGKSKTTYSDGTPSESSDIKFGDTDNDDLKGLDLGANFLAGYCFPNGLMISANFNQGLSNLVPKPTDNEKMKSHYFGIKLGWMLGGKEKEKAKK